MSVVSDDRSPLVSIIMPAYNAASTIEASLASIAAQTYARYEVLVVDDGSEDQTRAIVDRLAQADPRIRLLSQNHGGVSAARNLALAEAKGDFIALLDADDLWYPDKLALQIEAFAKAPAKVGLVYTWYDMIDEADRRLYCVRRQNSGAVLAAVCRNNFIGNSGTTLIRTSILRDIGGWDVRLRACEDWKVHFLIAEKYEFGLIRQILAGYRAHSGTATSSIEKMLNGFETVSAEILARHPEFRNLLRLHAVDLLMNVLLRTLPAREWDKSRHIVTMMLRQHAAKAAFVLAAAPAKALIRLPGRLARIALNAAP